MARNKILPLAFAVIGVIDFIYGIMKPDMVSLGMGAIMVGISLFILKREGTSA
jgi:hypothetical protein